MDKTTLWSWAATAVMSALLLAFVARAEFVAVPKSETFSDMSRQLDAVVIATRLDEQEGLLAKTTAASWFYIGPCSGSVKELNGHANGVIQAVVDAKPHTPWGAALLQMIAVMVRHNILGRTPSDDMCAFAKAMANS